MGGRERRSKYKTKEILFITVSPTDTNKENTSRKYFTTNMATYQESSDEISPVSLLPRRRSKEMIQAGELPSSCGPKEIDTLSIHSSSNHSTGSMSTAISIEPSLNDSKSNTNSIEEILGYEFASRWNSNHVSGKEEGYIIGDSTIASQSTFVEASLKKAKQKNSRFLGIVWPFTNNDNDTSPISLDFVTMAKSNKSHTISDTQAKLRVYKKMYNDLNADPLPEKVMAEYEAIAQQAKRQQEQYETAIPLVL